MIGLFCFALAVLALPFRSKLRLEAENAVLRHQLIVLRRRPRGRVRLTHHDRWFYPAVSLVSSNLERSHNHPARDAGALAQSWISLLLALEVAPTGRATQIETELRVLIRRMSVGNPLWGAPRIHGELLKLGFEVAQSSVAKYMVKRRGPPSQGWRTFLRIHAPSLAAMDLFVVPTNFECSRKFRRARSHEMLVQNVDVSFDLSKENITHSSLADLTNQAVTKE